jgi:PAS domain S-box-containing protein
MKTNLKILSIGENQKDQKKLEQYIASEKLPYELTVVGSVPEAREKLDLTEFDLVLSEYYLGNGTAFDQIDHLEDPPLIILAAGKKEKNAVQAFKTGAADYLFKDVQGEYLKLLPSAIEKTVQERTDENDFKKYHKQLEEIVAGRAHVLIQSNQRLTDETLQRAQAEYELRESKEIYRRFFQTSRDAVFITSEDGSWIDMNQSAVELFGYQKKEQLMSVNIFDLYYEPKEREGYTRVIKEQGFTKDYPFKLRKKDGSVFDALISSTLYEVDNKIVGYQGIIRDISQEIQSEEERQRLLNQQVVIDELSVDVGSILELETLYESIISHIVKLFDVNTFIISRYDQENDRIEAKFAWEDGKCVISEKLNILSLNKFGHGNQSSVIRSKKTAYIPDLGKHLLENNGIDLKDKYIDEIFSLEEDEESVNYSTLLAPLVVENHVIGVLQILNKQLDAYNKSEFALFTKIANVVAIGLQKAYLFEESEKLVEKLTTLNRIEQTILENLSLPTTLDMLVDQLVGELEVDAADILYFHPTLKTLKLIAQTGFRQNILQRTDLEIGEGYAGEAAQSRSTVHIPDLTQEETEFTQSLAFAAEQFVSYFGLPLLAKGKLVGVMEIFHRSPLDPDRQKLELFEMVAGLAAIAIDHQNLQKDLERSRTEIIKGFDAIIEGWAQALELRGIESPGHARRVVDMTLRLAGELGLSGDILVELRRGTLLHDIGKMGIPDQVLKKGKELTKEERKMIGRHPTDAFDLLGQIDALQSALDIPLYHHERWDGEGYPHGLKGEKIPFPARIFAIVDVWDALLTDRPYRDAWPREKAVAHIKEQSGKHFDPRVVNAFIKIIESDRELEQKSEKVGD